MAETLAALWPALLTTAQVLLAACASGHVILHKRDVRAAIGWVGLIWLVPLAGSTLYLLFGINRIRRRAADLRGPRPAVLPASERSASAARLARLLPERARHLIGLGELLDRITDTPLTEGNCILPLNGGNATYRAMIAAIDAAERTIGLLSYIFDDDPIGRAFALALDRAARRGVAVRVLVDGVGARYSRPAITRLLADLGLHAAEFLPTYFHVVLPYANLRNHRKILVVDGKIGFTGGMNIRAGHLQGTGADAIADVHFRLEGPVVDHLVVTFAEDWLFATGETLGDGWFQPIQENADIDPRQGVPARGIAAGPDEAFERIRWTILGALSLAERRVRIVTPYFVPDQTLMTGLSLAAMRGVEVDILIPERGNLRLVNWAARAKLGQLLIRGCRIWLVPSPFDHAKLMTVDDAWVLIGSANWDQRSLRLNFEFNVEAYGDAASAMVDGLIDRRMAAAHPFTLAEAEARPLITRLRDSAAWLASPYL